MKIKCIAVDDEPLGLQMLERFIDQTSFLELSESCSSAVEAMNVIQENQVDLLFLDINMPNLSGMELARLLQQSNNTPKIIFTTAYNHYAIEGYKVNAVDYLLKPFSYEEFLRAASKANQHLQPPAKSESTDENSLFVKVEFQWVRVDFSKILYIEGVKDYVKLRLQSPGKDILSRTSLKALEERLPGNRFMRIHRSYIVALDKITSITKNALCITKAEIPVGEQYRETFKAIVSKWIV